MGFQNMRNNYTRYTFLIAASLLVSACGSWWGGDDEVKLKGDRLSVLELEKGLGPDAVSGGTISLPSPWKNAFWPQAGGYPNHSMQHLSLSTSALKKVWDADIGAGGDDEIPLTAQPIMVYGEVYALDTKSKLSAFDAETGKRLWQINVGPVEDDDPVIGGGITYASGVIYVTNGYDEVLAVHPSEGEIFWRAPLSAPSRAAPTVMDNRLFVTTLDNRLQALNATNGDLLWEYIGISETSGLVGAASAAANHDIVIPAFSSGELTALRVENGSVAWDDNLANTSGYAGLSGIADIKALPVIDKGLVIAISFSGRLVAIDERTGVRIWQRDIGGTNTPWVAGDYVFVLTSENQLVALSRKSGDILWVTDIKNDEKHDAHPYFTGPLLAGNRLILAGSDGRVLEADPTTGMIAHEWDAGTDISVPPFVAGDTLYILDDNGVLSAYK